MTDAIGIEIGRHAVRAVRVDPRRPDELVGSEFTMDPADDGSIRDALVRTYGVVSSRGSAPPVRLALSPDRWLVQAVDVTGRARDEMIGVAADAAGRGVADSTTVLDDGVRRVMLLVRWDPPSAERFRSLATQSGFADATVEPAAVALGRVIPSGRHVIWRDVEEAVGWTAVYDDGIPLVGASIGPSGTEWPSLVGHIASGHHTDADDLLDADDVIDALLRIADRPLPGSAERPLRLPLGSRLVIGSSPLAEFPGHDLRAPARVAVCVGAALGAAGASAHRRTVEAMAPIHVPTSGSRLPWAVEPVPGERLEDHLAALRADARAGRRSTPDGVGDDAVAARRERPRGSRRRYRRRR